MPLNHRGEFRPLRHQHADAVDDTSLILKESWSVMSRQSALMGASPFGLTISVETMVPLSSVLLPRTLTFRC